MCLLSCHGDVRPPVEMRWGPMSFSRVSTGDSDIPSCCETKDEPGSTSLQGNLALFPFSASRCPFHLRHHTQDPSQIAIAERQLHLLCMWNVALPLESKPGNQLSSPDDLGCPGFSSCCFTEIDVPIDLRWVSQGISGLL